MKKVLFLIPITAILISACGTNAAHEPSSTDTDRNIDFHVESEKNKQKLETLELDEREEAEPSAGKNQEEKTENIPNGPTEADTEVDHQEKAKEQIEAKPEDAQTKTNEAVVNKTENDKGNDEKAENTLEIVKEEKVIPQIKESGINGLIKKQLPNTHSEPRTEIPTHIVLHFSSNVANNVNDPYQINDIYNIFLDYGVSTHYVVDRNGKIYQFIDENRTAYHAGKGNLPGLAEYTDRLNHYSIGIEILAIGTKEEMAQTVPHVDYHLIPPEHIGYNEKQYAELQVLIRDIVNRNQSIKFDRSHIIGHDEYTTRKADPGDLFEWSNIGL